MNPLTRKIKSKGYTLKQFLAKINYSLSWYRTHEKEGASSHEFLLSEIDKLDYLDLASLPTGGMKVDRVFIKDLNINLFGDMYIEFSSLATIVGCELNISDENYDKIYSSINEGNMNTYESFIHVGVDRYVTHLVFYSIAREFCMDGRRNISFRAGLSGDINRLLSEIERVEDKNGLE